MKRNKKELQKKRVPTPITNKLVTLLYGKRYRTVACGATKNAHRYRQRAEKREKHARTYLYHPCMPCSSVLPAS